MNSQGYPPMWEVAQAGQEQLMRWTRYLPSPNDDNRLVMEFILKRQTELKKSNPLGHVAASKRVGFEG